MVVPSFGTGLAPAVGTAALTEPGLVAAGDAARALSAVTMRTKIDAAQNWLPK
jgi:hypothetical protein